MVGSLLMRGMLIGVLAGLIAVGFAELFGEPQVDRAIAFESAMEHQEMMAHQAAGQPAEEEEPELVSRPVQKGIGLLTAGVMYGAGFGGLFSLVFAYAYGRIGKLGPRGVSALLALAGFIVVVLVPTLKYPANPPSVGNPDTIGERTELYFAMIVIGIAALSAAVVVGRRLLARFGAWNGTVLAVVGFIVVITAVQLLLPDINEVPDEFPAVVLWRFRVASLGMQVVIWSVLGLGFGVAAERVLAGARRIARPALS